jgi:CRISPR/Cas system Type II protein with McrA/HNH and RuvC-like nuclease domain
MFSYTLGLDIGIASVGWCVLGEDHIIALVYALSTRQKRLKKANP